MAKIYKSARVFKEGYNSPDRKKSPTFPDEIADNISNKCTSINTKSDCYEVTVAF